jgi:hypothetical protein
MHIYKFNNITSLLRRLETSDYKSNESNNSILRVLILINLSQEMIKRSLAALPPDAVTAAPVTKAAAAAAVAKAAASVTKAAAVAKAVATAALPPAASNPHNISKEIGVTNRPKLSQSDNDNLDTILNTIDPQTIIKEYVKNITSDTTLLSINIGYKSAKNILLNIFRVNNHLKCLIYSIFTESVIKDNCFNINKYTDNYTYEDNFNQIYINPPPNLNIYFCISNNTSLIELEMPERLKQYIINNFTIKRLYYIAQYILYSSNKNVNIIKEITSEIYKTEHHNKHLYKHYFIYKILDFIITNGDYNKKFIEDPKTSLQDAILIHSLAKYFTKSDIVSTKLSIIISISSSALKGFT